MPFYEIIYETGSNSVAQADNDEDVVQAIAEHHARARNGMPGGPDGHVAERVASVEVYDKHPATYGEDQTFSVDVAKKTANDLIDSLADENGVVAKHDLTQAILATSEALIRREDREPRKSQYKMKSKRSLDSALWEGTN